MSNGSVQLVNILKQCVPNYPDKNLPTVFVYKNGNLAVQWIGGGNFGPNPPLEVVEWMLHEKTIITSDIEKDPRKKTEDMFTRNVMNVSQPNTSSEVSGNCGFIRTHYFGWPQNPPDCLCT